MKTIRELNPGYPPNLTRRMIAIIRAFGDDKVKYPEEEAGSKLIDIPEAHFTRTNFGWAGFAIDYPGQLGLNVATDNITARPGGPQVGGTLLDAVYNRVTTVATSGDSVVLIPAVISSIMQVVTNVAANSVKVWVFPRGDGNTDLIDSGGGVSFFNVPAGKSAMFFTIVPTRLGVILSA